MSLGSAIAIYFVIWWISLFAILPWGVRSQHEDGEVVPGTDPGAPTRPRLRRIVVANTLFALVIFGLYYLIWSQGLFGLDDIPFLPDFSPRV